MEDILQQAKKLADLITNHERTKAFREAAAAVEADPEASKTQEAYAKAVDGMQRAEMEGRPIEPEQKRAFQAVADAVRRSPILVRMLQAHQAYMELMEGVQHVLGGGDEAEGDDAEGHEHGPGCSHDHGHEHGPGAPAAGGVAPADTAPPPKSGGILWTP